MSDSKQNNRNVKMLVFDPSRRHGYECLGDVCCTAEAFWGTGGGNVPLVLRNEEINNDAYSIGEKMGQTYVHHECGNTVAQRDYKQPQNVFSNTDPMVRRMMPQEEERLQGYPDGWTDIGEWIDSKGKRHKEADAPRYKALGNSICLPFWQYLARKMCAQYERTITIGSLFDGIGGFPLVFERCGAKAIWASEIEEFPMAVTKKHFPEDTY